MRAQSTNQSSAEDRKTDQREGQNKDNAPVENDQPFNPTNIWKVAMMI